MANLTTAAQSIAAIYQKELEKTFYDDVPLVKWLGEPRQNTDGQNKVQWNAKYAGNTSAENFSEGDTAAASGYCSFVGLELDFEHSWAFAELTGHLQAANSGSAKQFDIIEEEMQGLKDALWVKIHSNMVTALEAAYDDDASWASITRATYNMIPVVRTASATDLAEGDLKYVHINMRKRSAIVPGDTFILGAPEQMDKFEALLGTGAGNPVIQGQKDGSFSMGFNHKPMDYKGVPLIEVFGMTSTLLLWVRRSKIDWIKHQGLIIEPLGKSNDTTKFKGTWRGKLRIKTPYLGGRIEGLAV